MATPFTFHTGNPDNLTGNSPGEMLDIRGSFYDLRDYLNSGVLDPISGATAPFPLASSLQVKDIGESGQCRAGRQLAPTDFTAMGLSVPIALWNLGSTADASGNGRSLTNKGSVPFGPGINGTATTAAIFAGSTGQALYIADTGAADPFRIRTGSWGCWFRTAKRGVAAYALGKWSAAAGNRIFTLGMTTGNVLAADVYSDGSAAVGVTGISDVADDRWHFAVITHDGTRVRAYVDGALENSATAAYSLFSGNGPFNIGGLAADGATAGTFSWYGRVDEAFVTNDVLSDDQVRNLYAASLTHSAGAIPVGARLRVMRRRRGAAMATTDFPATPARLHNFVAGSLADQGSGGVALAPVGGGSIVTTAAPDGTRDGAYSFSGAHTGLGATDAGLPSGTAARSYGVWFKTTTANVIILGYGTQGTADVRLSTGGTGVIASANGADAMPGPWVLDGLWHHVVVVEDNAAGDGVKRKLYLDGRLVSGSTVLNTLTPAGANRFRVGANQDGTSPFTGQISRAFVYAGALTAEQVRALYNLGSMQLAPSPKAAEQHVEAFEAARALVVFDSLEGSDLITMEALA